MGQSCSRHWGWSSEQNRPPVFVEHPCIRRDGVLSRSLLCVFCILTKHSTIQVIHTPNKSLTVYPGIISWRGGIRPSSQCFAKDRKWAQGAMVCWRDILGSRFQNEWSLRHFPSCVDDIWKHVNWLIVVIIRFKLKITQPTQIVKDEAE